MTRCLFQTQMPSKKQQRYQYRPVISQGCPWCSGFQKHPKKCKNLLKHQIQLYTVPMFLILLPRWNTLPMLVVFPPRLNPLLDVATFSSTMEHPSNVAAESTSSLTQKQIYESKQKITSLEEFIQKNSVFIHN